MSLHTTEALILRTYKLNDADRIVVFLTRDHGKKRGVAKGARRVKSRFRASLEPLTRAVVVYFEKENRELVSLNSVDLVRSPLSAGDPDALGYVGYLAELMDECAQDSDPNETLYRLGAAVLEALADTTAVVVAPAIALAVNGTLANGTLPNGAFPNGRGIDIAPADAPQADTGPVERLVRYFEYWLLRLQGVYPSLAACQACRGTLADGARLAARQRTLVCCGCAPAAGAITLSPQAVGFLRSAAGVPPARLMEIALTPGAARELEAAHRTLIAWHLEKELRSTRVLRDMH